jgi:aminopeptidase
LPVYRADNIRISATSADRIGRFELQNERESNLMTMVAETRLTIPETFPAFSLSRLLRTVFRPKPGERIAILIDLKDTYDVTDFRFLKNPSLTIQRHAYEIFYNGLQNGVLNELKLRGGDLFAYMITGGSNLDLPDLAVTPAGKEVRFERDIYPNYDLILCISTCSATAPLTAFAKKYGFRGATLHGLNQTILDTGLAVDYEMVSRNAEKLRLGMTEADWVEIDFEVDGDRHTLRLELGHQEAQKSHGLCRGGPDIANLPAGEVYFVPISASGRFPLKFDDGTIGLMSVRGGRIVDSRLLHGNPLTIEAHQKKVQSDPVTGELGELGFGTQLLPVSGRDIQDEKILGTIHVATGRSDHLGGLLTPDKFADRKNATHDDILFAPHKTPEINVSQVRMHRHGKIEILIENFTPAHYMANLLE